MQVYLRKCRFSLDPVFSEVLNTDTEVVVIVQLKNVTLESSGLN